MNESNHESKKITWTQILRAVIQAAIAALTALGIISCASVSYTHLTLPTILRV